MNNVIVGCTLILLGTIAVVLGPLFIDDTAIVVIIITFGGAFILIGAFMAINQQFQKIKLSKHLELVFAPQESAIRTNSPANLAEKQNFARRRAIPGRNAPIFSAISLARTMPDTLTLPTASPMIPMYRLDEFFRIIDWNEAFSLAFDRSMEGMRGESALEWVYHLENYQDVIKHGEAVFAGGKALPRIDIETLKFKSDVYGDLTAEKRAYQIPNDNEDCAGWLVILDPEFSDSEKAAQFNADLANRLSKQAMWSDYAISYDAVLTNTNIYPELLDTIMGKTGDLAEISANTKVLDLGAGTGNLAHRLVRDPDKPRLVYALDYNQTMLNLLEQRCKNFIRHDDKDSGIIVLNQDITSLAGLPNNYFDYAIMNNVLYALSQPENCLSEVHRVLKPNGEVRISGPKERSNIKKLFQRIKKDLKANKKLDDLRAEFEHVERINMLFLKNFFPGWSVETLEEMLQNAGFKEITYRTEKAYAGQALLVAATK